MLKVLTWEGSEVSEFQSEKSEMLSEASALIRQSAERRAGESVKNAINRMARALRWSITRTKSIWYEEARRIDAHEMDQLRKLRAEQAARYSRIAAALQATDPDMYCEEITALVDVARRLCDKDCP